MRGLVVGRQVHEQAQGHRGQERVEQPFAQAVAHRPQRDREDQRVHEDEAVGEVTQTLIVVEAHVVQRGDEHRGEDEALATVEQAQGHLIVAELDGAVQQPLQQPLIVEARLGSGRHRRWGLGESGQEPQQFRPDSEVQEGHRGGDERGRERLQAEDHLLGHQLVAGDGDRTQRHDPQRLPERLGYHVVLDHGRRRAGRPRKRDPPHGDWNRRRNGELRVDASPCSLGGARAARGRVLGLGTVVQDSIPGHLHPLGVQDVDSTDRVEVVRPIVLDDVVADRQHLRVGELDPAVSHAPEHRPRNRGDGPPQVPADIVADDGQDAHADELVGLREIEESRHADAVHPHVEDAIALDEDFLERAARHHAPAARLAAAVRPRVAGPAGIARIIGIDAPPARPARLAVGIHDDEMPEGDPVADAAVNQVVDDAHPLGGAADLDPAAPGRGEASETGE